MLLEGEIRHQLLTPVVVTGLTAGPAQQGLWHVSAGMMADAQRVVRPQQLLKLCVYAALAYSYGRAEEMLSGWIRTRGFKRGDIVVGSKW
jgi:hypothetical protein